MKKKSLFVVAALAVIITIMSINACKVENNNTDYLKEVLSNLEQIKSASYNSYTEVYTPWDTLPAFVLNEHEVEYSNPADTFLGASFVKYLMTDSLKFNACYDGNIYAKAFDKQKKVVIDSFKFSRHPIRVISGPFFFRNKKLIEYFLESNDSLIIESIDYGDSIQYSFTIYDDVIEIIGKHIVHNTEHLSEKGKGKISKYDIWIDKSNDLPYRIKRDMDHEKTIQKVKNIKLNNLDLKDFKAIDHFPPSYIIKEDIGYVAPKKLKLEGKLAPDWILKNVYDESIALKDLKSKVLVIQFTGIGCGACIESIPFMKQLASEYRDKDFELVSIETWRDKITLLKNYQDKNEFNFKFLNADDKIKKDYHISAVPVFFILDENRIIRKVVNGYGKRTTDKEIKDAINELL